MPSRPARLGRQAVAYAGAVVLTAAGLILGQGLLGPLVVERPAYDWLAEVPGQLLLFAGGGLVLLLLPFLLARSVAARVAAAPGGAVGPALAALAGLLSVGPVLVVLELALGRWFEVDAVVLVHSVLGGLAGGWLYRAFGGFPAPGRPGPQGPPLGQGPRGPI